jgi:hypothetical protein
MMIIIIINQGVRTDRGVLANRPDIGLIAKNKKVRTSLLIYVAMPSDRNVIQMEAEKKIKI